MADSIDLENQIGQSENRLALSGKWGVQQAKRLHTELQAALSSEENATLNAIDCTRIDNVDLAGIQLILAAKGSQDVQVELDHETSTAKWFGLCGVGQPDFEFDN